MGVEEFGKKTSSQISPILKEWADMILFVNYKTFSVATDDKGTKHKAQGGTRTMYTTHHPCWDAKNRHNLPDEMPFEYERIAHCFKDNAPTQTVTPTVTPHIRADCFTGSHTTTKNDSCTACTAD